MQSCSLVPPIRVGIRARVRVVFPDRLPRGLTEGGLVTVERLAEGQCTVRDKQGASWTIPVTSVDPGHLVWKDGHWMPGED